MKKKGVERSHIKKLSFKKNISVVVLITILFTLIDTIVHYFWEALEIYYYPIPKSLEFISSSPLFWYAIGKFVATIIFGVILLYFLVKVKWNFYLKTFIFSAVIVALLEVRYALSGYYGTQWHIYNTIMHFIVLYISSIAVFRSSKVFGK